MVYYVSIQGVKSKEGTIHVATRFQAKEMQLVCATLDNKYSLHWPLTRTV